jgi:hypothetical protein
VERYDGAGRAKKVVKRGEYNEMEGEVVISNRFNYEWIKNNIIDWEWSSELGGRRLVSYMEMREK